MPASKTTSKSRPKAAPQTASKTGGKTASKAAGSAARKPRPASPASPARSSKAKGTGGTSRAAGVSKPAKPPKAQGSARPGTTRRSADAPAKTAAAAKSFRKPTKALVARVLERCDKSLGPVELPECRSVLERAVYLVLREQGTELTTAKALAVLREEFVDWNEVRISRPSELSRLMAGSGKGAAVRRFHDRAERIRELIDQIYNDRNDVSLEFLLEEGSKGRFEYLEDIDDLGLHNAYALVQWLSGEDKLALVSKEFAEAACALGLLESAAVSRAKADLAELTAGAAQVVALQAHLNQLGGMDREQWPPMIRELLA